MRVRPREMTSQDAVWGNAGIQHHGYMIGFQAIRTCGNNRRPMMPPIPQDTTQGKVVSWGALLTKIQDNSKRL
ncbi:MAG TPA: hypothetical protein VGL89_15980, partial [Candidatus Koribacter sp.]